ncbi:heparinase II/III family protein [Oscillospiraceae bacterium DSM 107454]|uniref:Heparinase II/III family protein n=1 Tax=Ructibacterium gallinarum TaxID=2779355 RepID=A0A9D5M699_9FIRM|nr:heparinase II/III family protein [Ructibacterium gallinarum]
MVVNEELRKQIEEAKELFEREEKYHSKKSNAIFAWQISKAEEVLKNGSEKEMGLALDGGSWAMLFGITGAARLYQSQRLMETAVPEEKALFGSMRNRKEDYLFFSASELAKLRGKLSHPLIQKEWKRIREIADEYSLKDTENIPIYMKAWRQLPFNFHTVSEACTAKIRFALPEGEVYLDKICLKESSTGIKQIPNTSFVNAVLVSEKRKETYGNRGRLSVENVIALHGTDEIETMESIEIKGNADYTLDLFVKQEKPLMQLLRISVLLYDLAGNCVQIADYDWNRLTHIRWDYMFERSCADAVVYLLTGEEEYAKKAAAELLYMLSDMKQTGVLYFMQYNQKPFDDGYGTVHMGRAMAGLCMIYDILRKAPGLMTEEQQKEIEKGIFFIAFYLGQCGTVNCENGGLRYFPEMEDQSSLLLGGNWTTDQFAGLGYFALTFPEHPLSPVYLENSKAVVKKHLEELTDPDGIWPESMRYHFAVLQGLLLYALVLKRNEGTDLAVNPKFKKMYQYALETQLPQYCYTDNTISHLVFGDDNLGTGKSFWHFNLASTLFRDSDPVFADRLLATWKKSGGDIAFDGLNGWLLPFILTDADSVPMDQVGGLQSQCYPHFGLAVLRSNAETERDTHVTVVCTKNCGAHGHFDLGSFSYFANGVPLSLDPGVESYWDNSLKWYRSSAAHATVQFDGQNVLNSDGGLGMVYEEEDKIRYFSTSDELDYLMLTVKNPAGDGWQIRHLILHKKSGALIVYDQIEDFRGETVWNLPLCSRETMVRKKEVIGKGHFDTDIKVQALLPESPQITVERGAVSPGALPAAYQDYVRIHGKDTDCFLVVLQPVRRDTPTVSVALKEGVLYLDKTPVKLQIIEGKN